MRHMCGSKEYTVCRQSVRYRGGRLPEKDAFKS